MKIQNVALLGAALLTLGLAGPAGAASVVDVTYELSGTNFTTTLFGKNLTGASSCIDQCLAVEVLSSSMKVRYTSNSQSSMPILHGPATMLSLTLNARITLYTLGSPFTSANANINLASPVAGSLLSGATLAFTGAQLVVTGSRHCAGATYFSGACIALIGTLTSIVGPLGPLTNLATFTLAASAGPYGGAQSTRQTVSGTLSAYIPSKAGSAFGTGHFATGAKILGREILREAEGHDPKVIPEPGTLLLLGAGTAGLALVGRATRRARG